MNATNSTGEFVGGSRLRTNPNGNASRTISNGLTNTALNTAKAAIGVGTGNPAFTGDLLAQLALSVPGLYNQATSTESPFALQAEYMKQMGQFQLAQVLLQEGPGAIKDIVGLFDGIFSGGGSSKGNESDSNSETQIAQTNGCGGNCGGQQLSQETTVPEIPGIPPLPPGVEADSGETMTG